MFKECQRCHSKLKITEFYKQKNGRVSCYCKPCDRDRKTEWKQKWRQRILDRKGRINQDSARMALEVSENVDWSEAPIWRYYPYEF